MDDGMFGSKVSGFSWGFIYAPVSTSWTRLYSMDWNGLDGLMWTASLDMAGSLFCLASL